MKRFLPVLLSIFFLFSLMAFPALAEEPTSHVAESSGNGYALYNGVKLPNIDTVWTDKETYPYAFISSVEFDEIGTVYSLNLWSVNPPNGQTITSPIYFAHYSFAYGAVDDWTLDDSGSNNSGTVTKSGCFWTSHDILNTDGTIYLAASSPIPLDGMTVIEWDGVTDGLSSLPLTSNITVYKMAEYENASDGIVVQRWYSDSDVNVINQLDTFDGGWSIGNLAFAQEEQGVLMSVIGGGTDVASYCALLAYTPAGSEPDMPVPDLEAPAVAWGFTDRELIVSEYHPIVAIGNIGADGQCILYSRSLNSDGSTSSWSPIMEDEVMYKSDGYDICAFDLYPDESKVPYSMQYKAVVTLGSGTNTATAETDVLTIHWVKSATVDPTEPTEDSGGSTPGTGDSDDDVPMLQAILRAVNKGFNNVGVWFAAQFDSIRNAGQSIIDSIGNWGQSIKDSIDSLPDKIAEALSGMFVPSDSAIQDFGESSQQIAQDRFGGVYEGAMILDSFAGQLQAQAATQILTVPVVNLNILGTPFPLGGWDVDLVPEGSEAIIEAVKLMIDIVATLAFINGIKSRLERMLEQ